VIFITWTTGRLVRPCRSATAEREMDGRSPAKGPNYANTQFSYGTRVGCLVIGPYSKRGISKAFHSHVSLVKFCEVTFGLKPINARDAASDDMSDCFDFKQTPLPAPS